MTAARPRVLVVLGGIPLYGAELATIDVGCMLRESGAEVLFATNAHWGHVAVYPRLDALQLPHEGLVFFGSLERRPGLRRLLVLLRLMVTENLRLWRLLRRFEATDVHLGSHWDAFNLWPALRWSGARLRLHVHNVPVVRQPLLRAFWRALLRRCAAVVAVSEPVAQALRDQGLCAAPVVVPNRPPRRPAAALPEVPRAARTVFVFVGQVAPFKGVDHLVAAVEGLRAEGLDVACHVVGGIASARAEALRQRAGEGPAADRIQFHGYVDDPRPWLRGSDVLVVPSLADEAFGMVVVEAKAVARPAVVYADGALQLLVRDRVDGQVVPRGDMQALHAALRAYALDASLAGRHGAAAEASLDALGIAQVPARWRALYGMAP